MKRFTILLLAMLASVALVVAACGDDDDNSSNGDDGGDDGGATVAVTLHEFSVIPDVSSVDAGDVTFNIENVGPDDPHEFVIMKTDLAAGELPTGDDGAVDEEGDGVELIDEVEELEVGDTGTLTANLEAGSYVLLCNLVEEEDDGLESHYQLGMRTAFTAN